MKEFFKQAQRTFPKFLYKVKPLNQNFLITSRGVWASECFALCAMMDLFKNKNPMWYIESGCYKGQSVDVINTYYKSKKDFNGITYDYNVSSVYSRIYAYRYKWLLKGSSSFDLIERDIDNINSCGVFIDGPKGWDALKLAELIIDKSNVNFIAIHDCYKPCDQNLEQYKFRKHLEDNYATFFTDDPEFVAEYGLLDNSRWPEYLEEDKQRGILPYIRINKGQYQLLESYGPTIGFIWK